MLFSERVTATSLNAVFRVEINFSLQHKKQCSAVASNVQRSNFSALQKIRTLAPLPRLLVGARAEVRSTYRPCELRIPRRVCFKIYLKAKGHFPGLENVPT